MQVLERRARRVGHASHDVFASRFASLTDRELRLLVLAVEEDFTPSRISEVLGISRAAVSNAVARIRRKLAVPSGQDLKIFIGSVPELDELVRAVDVSALPWSGDDRRARDVLRITISELEALASRAGRRATALRDVGGNDADGGLVDEAERIEAIVDLLECALNEALTIARSSAAAAHHSLPTLA